LEESCEQQQQEHCEDHDLNRHVDVWDKQYMYDSFEDDGDGGLKIWDEGVQMHGEDDESGNEDCHSYHSDDFESELEEVPAMEVSELPPGFTEIQK
jgi:hypothetical protein